MKTIAVTDDYRDFTDEKKLREKKWARDFADYIVDENFTPQFAARTKRR